METCNAFGASGGAGGGGAGGKNGGGGRTAGGVATQAKTAEDSEIQGLDCDKWQSLGGSTRPSQRMPMTSSRCSPGRASPCCSSRCTCPPGDPTSLGCR